MFTVLKKHKGLFFFLVLVCYGSFTIYDYIKDSEDRSDWRWYPITITEPSKIIIDYKANNYSRYSKCFALTLNYEQLEQNFPIYRNNYEGKYNYYIGTDEEFFSEIKNKPHFIIKIYQGSKLVIERDVYIMWIQGSINRTINEKPYRFVRFMILEGFFNPRWLSCYHFKAGERYKIEVINTTALPEYKDIESFFLIQTEKFK